MKKVRSLFLLSFVLLLAACGNGQGGTEEPTKTPEPTESTPAPEASVTPEAEDNTADEDYLQYTLKLDEKHQVIDGFGGAFTWYTDQVFRTNNANGLLDAAFTDAKLSIIRFKNEYAYSMEGTAGNIGPMVRVYEAAVDRAAEYGEEPTILLSCWSPPANLKSNHSINGGGTLAKHEDGTYMYEEYAQWWVDSVNFYRDWGVKIDYVSIQNECDFVASYDGCEFAKEESETYASYSKAFLAVYNAFREEFGEDAPKLIAPETMTCEPAQLYGYVKEIIETEPESINGIGYHLYIGGDSDEDNNTVKYDSFVWNFMDLEKYFGEYGYARWQTEFFRGRGLQTAALINNAMVQADMNAYIYWSAVWPNDAAEFEAGELIGIQNGKKVNEDGWILCADYYAVRHFSEFIRPGFTRVGASMEGGVNFKASAYVSEDGKQVVLVVINLSKEEKTLQIPAEGYKITGSDLYQSVLGIEDSSNNVLYENIGALKSGNTVSLPGESITTVVLSLE
ncbi:MAG: glycoside hydrolase family 30 beta sandwich domain-containing protein [Lachnospiraceae bacterium]